MQPANRAGVWVGGTAELVFLIFSPVFGEEAKAFTSR